MSLQPFAKDRRYCTTAFPTATRATAAQLACARRHTKSQDGEDLLLLPSLLALLLRRQRHGARFWVRGSDGPTVVDYVF